MQEKGLKYVKIAVHLVLRPRSPQEAGMKKLMVMVFALLLLANTVSASRGKAIVNLYGTTLSVAANSFTNQDSRYKTFFEVKAAYVLSGNLYLWASHGYFPMRDSWKAWEKKSSFLEDSTVDRTVAKRVIAGGCGFFIGYFEPGEIAVRAEAGACSIANDIESTVNSIATDQLIRSASARQRGLGVRGNLAVTYGLYKNVFAEASLGYMLASDKIEGVRSNLGGFHLALGVGMQL